MTIAKRLSHQGHLRLEISLIDREAWPDTGEQFVLGDELTGALSQSD